jgi:hypothetical protein
MASLLEVLDDPEHRVRDPVARWQETFGDDRHAHVIRR